MNFETIPICSHSFENKKSGLATKNNYLLSKYGKIFVFIFFMGIFKITEGNPNME